MKKEKRGRKKASVANGNIKFSGFCKVVYLFAKVSGMTLDESFELIVGTYVKAVRKY